MAIADQIRSRRTALGWTQAELARRAKISKTYLHQLESEGEERRPSADVLYRIAFALGASVGELLEKDIPDSSSSPFELTDVADSLRAFAHQAKLAESDIKMLAGIQYRGERPKTMEDWRYIYESIQRTIG